MSFVSLPQIYQIYQLLTETLCNNQPSALINAVLSCFGWYVDQLVEFLINLFLIILLVYFYLIRFFVNRYTKNLKIYIYIHVQVSRARDVKTNPMALFPISTAYQEKQMKCAWQSDFCERNICNYTVFNKRILSGIWFPWMDDALWLHVVHVWYTTITKNEHYKINPFIKVIMSVFAKPGHRSHHKDSIPDIVASML